MNTKLSVLEESLSKAVNPKEKIDIRAELSWEMRLYSPEKALDLSVSTLEDSKKINYKKGIASSFLSSGAAYYLLSEYSKALTSLEKAISYFKDNEDILGHVRALSSLGLIYTELGLYEKALDSLLEALETNKVLKDQLFEAKILNDIGDIYRICGSWDQSYDYYIKSIMIYDELGDIENQASPLINMGLIYKSKEEYLLSLECFCNGLNIVRRFGNRIVESYVLLLIGDIHFLMENYDNAMSNFILSMDKTVQLKNKYYEILALYYIARLHFKRGALKLASSKLANAYSIADENNVKLLKYIVLKLIEEVSTEKKEFSEAEKVNKEAENLRNVLFTSELEKKLKHLSLQSEINYIKKKAWFLQKKNIDLEKIALEKSKELRESYEEIEKQNKQINEYNEKLEEIIKERTVQLLQSEKLASLGALVSGVAHEINTPVGVSITAASHMDQLLENFVKLYRSNSLKKTDMESFVKDMNESVEIICSNLKRASDMIDNFKLVAVDRRTDERRKINFKDYVRGIVLSLKSELKKTNIVIEIIAQDYFDVDTYPGSISQILVNLIQNSMVHAFEKSAKGHIAIEGFSEDDMFVIKYSDDGIGIHDDVLPKIFDPFFTTNRYKGGTGLGLNIVYNLVTQKLKGSISCNSQVNCGTSFTIKLPLLI